MKKTIIALATILIFAGIATSCNSKTKKEEESKTLTFGFSPGPYSDIFKLGIKPGLEKKGYEIKTVEFTDWVTPNIALANKEIDANIFQHTRYLNLFSKDKGLELSPVISIPTASLGLYTRKLNAETIDELKDELKSGKKISIPHDPSNLARTLIFLENIGLISIKANIDQSKASEKDIDKNPYGLVFVPVDAAQLPRTLESTDLAVISGNYAISAGIKLSTAIIREKLEADTENVVAIRTEDLDKSFITDIKEVIKSSEFEQIIENPDYDFLSFERPAWYIEQWGE